MAAPGGIRGLMKKKAKGVDVHADISVIDHSRHNYAYDGSPDGALTGELLALCWDYTNSDIYINTDGATAWSKIVN